jgi:polysaccharide biosynthesis/export protein
MKHLPLILTILLFSGCTSQQKLAYLNNLPEAGGEETFLLDKPDYRIQTRDILYITIKAMKPDGMINDFLSTNIGGQGVAYAQGESGGYLTGYEVNSEGNIIIPAVGEIRVLDLTLEEIRKLLQANTEKVFKNATVECKLLSFKYTVIGEVRSPGAYTNYNSYLTILEAIGHAGGVTDFGDRSKVLVVRSFNKNTRTYTLNIQNKEILASEAYYLLPNDVIIIEPMKQKIFNINLPTLSFLVSAFTSTITMTLLLINYFGK